MTKPKKTKKFDDLRKKMKPVARKKAVAKAEKEIKAMIGEYKEYTTPRPYFIDSKLMIEPVGYKFKYTTTPKPGQVDNAPLPKLTLWQRFKNLFN